MINMKDKKKFNKSESVFYCLQESEKKKEKEKKKQGLDNEYEM